MAPPPNKPHHATLGLAARVNDCLPAQSTGLLLAGTRRRVKTHTVGQVVVLHVDGPLNEIVADLVHEIRLALADAPRGVVCDLTAVSDENAPGALRVLAAAGRHVRDWPGIPVAVACPDEQVRDSLRTKPLSEHLLITGSVRLALSAILEHRTPVVASVRLTPHPTAPRAARDFVTRTLSDWGLSQSIPSACLLVSELVTNSIVHAGTDIDVSIATHLYALRVTVRDHAPAGRCPEMYTSTSTGEGSPWSRTCLAPGGCSPPPTPASSSGRCSTLTPTRPRPRMITCGQPQPRHLTWRNSMHKEQTHDPPPAQGRPDSPDVRAAP